MATGISRYRADLRDFQFVLFEQFGFKELCGRLPFEAWGPDEAKAALEQAYRFAQEALAPLHASADREGCRLDAGQVRTPAGFKAAWAQLYEAGFPSVSARLEFGGQSAPLMLGVLVEELLSGSNAAFYMYPALAQGAANCIVECGTPEQIQRLVPRLVSGKWAGTMCLTEPQAGSDVGAATSSAVRFKDGSYRISGNKIFISAGDHDLSENILHLVLARVEGAPPGTKGLSLFAVPKYRQSASGIFDAPNDVQVTGIEHKMGINGSATCALAFGEAGDCIGELIGGVENAGMAQMFKMMNGARLGVAIQGLATASTAYLNALAYAKERKQGTSLRDGKNPSAPRARIIEHPDVRRMLIQSKAYVEGIRALLVKLAWHHDRGLVTSGTEEANYHRGQVELLTPVAKAYASDLGFDVCVDAIQVFGGAGYLKDHPVEQYARDAKIFSIYEGTNHIQALDLVMRKLTAGKGVGLLQLFSDIARFIQVTEQSPTFVPELQTLGKAAEALGDLAKRLFQWNSAEKLHLSCLAANRFLHLLGDMAVGFLLLEAAAKSEAAQASVSDSHPDRAFYEGKQQSARWFLRNVVSLVPAVCAELAKEDASAMEISEAAFASGEA